jgi:hypothetical protein
VPDREDSDSSSIVPFALFAIPVLAIFVYMCGAELLRDARQLLVFQHTEGTVVSYVAPNRTAPKEVAAGRLEYSYSVESVIHAGIYPPEYVVNMPRLPYPLLGRGWRVGDHIEVYFDPADPAKSTLQPRIDPFPFVMFTFCTPIAVLIFKGLFQGDKVVALQDVGGGMQVAGGTIFWPLYVISSAVLAFAFVFASKLLVWQADAVLGVLLPTVIIPVTINLIVCKVEGQRAEDGVQAGASSTAAGDQRKFVVLAAVSLFWWLIVGTFLWLITIAPLIRALPALSNYRSTDGKITASRLRQVDASDRGGPSFSAELAYIFNVGQGEYRGSRVSFAEPIATADADQRSMIEAYPVGKRVKVFYDPQDPQFAVLDLDILKYQLFLDFFIVPFVLIGAVLLWCTVKAHVGTDLSWSKRASRAATWFIVTHIASIFILAAAGAIQPSRSWLVWYAVAADAIAIALALGTSRKNAELPRRAIT